VDCQPGYNLSTSCGVTQSPTASPTLSPTTFHPTPAPTRPNITLYLDPLTYIDSLESTNPFLGTLGDRSQTDAFCLANFRNESRNPWGFGNCTAATSNLCYSNGDDLYNLSTKLGFSDASLVYLAGEIFADFPDLYFVIPTEFIGNWTYFLNISLHLFPSEAGCDAYGVTAENCADYTNVHAAPECFEPAQFMCICYEYNIPFPPVPPSLPPSDLFTSSPTQLPSAAPSLAPTPPTPPTTLGPTTVAPTLSPASSFPSQAPTPPTTTGIPSASPSLAPTPPTTFVPSTSPIQPYDLFFIGDPPLVGQMGNRTQAQAICLQNMAVCSRAISINC
jgi:hypothetical protein